MTTNLLGKTERFGFCLIAIVADDATLKDTILNDEWCKNMRITEKEKAKYTAYAIEKGETFVDVYGTN